MPHSTCLAQIGSEGSTRRENRSFHHSNKTRPGRTLDKLTSPCSPEHSKEVICGGKDVFFFLDLNNGEFPALGVWFVLEKGKDILNIYSNFSQRSSFVRRKENTEFKRIQNYCKNYQCCVLRENTSRQTQNDHSRILGLFRITADLGSGMIKRNKKITLMKGIKLCFQLQ